MDAKTELLTSVAELLFVSTDGLIYGSFARHFATQDPHDVPDDLDIVLPAHHYNRFLRALHSKGKIFTRVQCEGVDQEKYRFLKLPGTRHYSVEVFQIKPDGVVEAKLDITTSSVFHPTMLDQVPVYSPIDAFLLDKTCVLVRRSAAMFFPGTPAVPSFLFRATMDLLAKRVAPVVGWLEYPGALIAQVSAKRFAKLRQKGFALAPITTMLQSTPAGERCVICHYEPNDEASDERVPRATEAFGLNDWYRARSDGVAAPTAPRNRKMVSYAACTCHVGMCVDCLLDTVFAQVRDQSGSVPTNMDADVRLKCPVRCRKMNPHWFGAFCEAMLLKFVEESSA